MTASDGPDFSCRAALPGVAPDLFLPFPVEHKTRAFLRGTPHAGASALYFFAYAMQLLLLLCALAGGGLAIFQLYEGRSHALKIVERLHWLVSGSLLLASALLLHALFWKDFSLQYVASYTDVLLPAFYRLTAFWAGQPGSMLFWALSVGIMGSLFALTRAYTRLTPSTRLWFWLFFYGIMAFFGLVLTTWSNPFVMQTPVPADGSGLNPLLQNPGMIFHPPLLFLGYGGFAVPSCLALAQALSGARGSEDAWFRISRPFIILAWLFLTAGIVLGMWWAYMELGWGGYWAWDPVENASLLPWLIGSAALHTLVIEDRRGKLARVNVALMSLCTVTAFFATYLVRSGVIQSVHAFGDGGVGTPLLLFVLAGCIVSFWAAFSEKTRGETLENFFSSREGLLVLVAWILIALGVIILVATMWPVLSRLWSSSPSGLDANFYNRVCLPLGTLLMLVMAICPWFGWNGGCKGKGGLLLTLGAAAASVGCLLWWLAGQVNPLPLAAHLKQPMPLIAAAAAGGVTLACLYMLLSAVRNRAWRRAGALGTHLGMALMALGIAVSGPYKIEKDVYFNEGGSDTVGKYTVTLLSLEQGRNPVGFDYLEARVRVEKDGRVLGIIGPQRRLYDKFGQMNQFSEVDVIPGLGEEVYASLLALDESSRVLVRISVEPLINWLWIGGALMCLAPFLSLCRAGQRRSPGEEKNAA